MKTNRDCIGKMTESIKSSDLLLFEGYSYSKVYQAKNDTIRWRWSLKTCPAKVYKSVRNIKIRMMVNKKINEYFGHKQPSVVRKLYSKERKRKAQDLYMKPIKVLWLEVGISIR